MRQTCGAAERALRDLPQILGIYIARVFLFSFFFFSRSERILANNGPLSLTAVFSKSYCPYCNASKKLLDSMGAKYYKIELDQVDDGALIQNALVEISGQRTVPNIYIGQKHIGGNSDLQAKSGELKSLLKEVGAL